MLLGESPPPPPPPPPPVPYVRKQNDTPSYNKHQCVLLGESHIPTVFLFLLLSIIY